MRDLNPLAVLSVCLLLGSGLALDCMDPSIDPDQGVDRQFGVSLGTQVPLDPESCRKSCCGRPDCDVAVVGFPADGEPQCELWKCPSRNQDPDRDGCVFKPNPQFKIYRKKVEKESSPHVKPLVNRNNLVCVLPVAVGMCRASFPRFFFNLTERKCRGFVFGGCGGNDNNFNTEEECDAACSGHTGEPLPADSDPKSSVKLVQIVPANKKALRCEGAGPVTGPCRASFPRWFFNSQTGTCQSFVYGGCLGNDNNHLSHESCMRTCSGSVQASPDESHYEEDCVLTPDPGMCRAAFPKFYFHLDSATCRPFLFGGCGGNNNRFDSEEQCLRRCSRDGLFDTREKTRHRWTSAFFLFTTLAMVSALLLVTLVLVSLRRRRLSRRAYISDKEELLSDDQSSVDSLPLPEDQGPHEDQA